MPPPILIHLHVYFLVTLKRCRSDDESREGTNTGDPTVDFEQEASQTEDEEDEDIGLPPELERIIAQEDLEMRSH